jgi:hypothetical protein
LKEGLEANRKICLKQQSELRHKLLNPEGFQEARQLFFKQHAMLHSIMMVQSESFTLEDEVFEGLSEEKARRIPSSSEHSIVWNIWHIARIEDVAMNMVVAGSPQILIKGNWLEGMNITARHTGNAMDEQEVIELSKSINIEMLRTYRASVGRRTREIVNAIQPQDLKNKVDPSRLDQVMAEGAVSESASWLIDYWRKRSTAGLLLMPATRHNLVHLNECFRLKYKRSRIRQSEETNCQ